MAVFHTRSGDVKSLLKKRFTQPEWAIFFEVGDATGGRQLRWADAVAMNLWPSRGLSINGFEIKVSRQDWLNELKNPAKAEAIAKHCDFWWLVAAEGVVREGELPETWGLFEVGARGLIIKKQAPRLPEPTLTRAFMASLMRRAGEVDDAQLRSMVDARIEGVHKQAQERIDREVKEHSRQHNDLKSAVEDFERESGLSISGWKGGKKIGKAVSIVEKLGVGSSYGSARQARNLARSFADSMDKILADVGDEVEGSGDDEI